MHCVIYRFEIHPGKDQQFLAAWRALTEFIYQYENSLGSRIHSSDHPNTYIAYAQWPDRATFENSGGNLPPEANTARNLMREACHNITTLHQLELVGDLLAQKPFTTK